MKETIMVEFARAAGAEIGKTVAKKVLEEGCKTLIGIATDSTENPSTRRVAIIGITAILISFVIITNKK
jgi:hypothetical protein